MAHSQQQDYNNFPQHPTRERETVSGYNKTTNFVDINNQSYNYNDNYPQHNFQQHQTDQSSQISDRETSLDCINYNITAATSVSMSNIYQNYNDNSFPCNDHQDGVGDIAYPQQQQQQVNLPQHHTSERKTGPDFNNLLTGNVGNNEMSVTQDISMI